jgi:predicted DNA-binding transcriptional regulator AlpA
MARRTYTLLGLAEVGETLGMSRRHAARTVTRDDFPEPVHRVRATPLWERRDVERWGKQHESERRRRT